MTQHHSPYKIVKHQHVTEKAAVLQQLHVSDSNVCTRRCEQAKYVFIVDPAASKTEVKKAVEEIYKERNVQVVKVNTINGKTKPRRIRGRRGRTAGYKKAIVTLAKGDTLDEV